MSITGRKSTSLDHGNDGSTFDPAYSFDSDWGPLQGVHSREESFDDPSIPTNVNRNTGKKYQRFGAKMFRMMSEGSTASSVSENDVTDQYSASPLADEESDDDECPNDETKPLNGRLASDRANTKLLRNAVKKQLELNRFQSSEVNSSCCYFFKVALLEVSVMFLGCIY